MYFCDAILVMDGNSTDGTRELCAKFSNVEMIINKPNRLFTEGQDREFLASLAQRYNPKWICAPDGDEEFASDTWGQVKTLLDDPSVRIIEQHILNLWDSKETVRWDKGWSEQYRQRFWRFMPGELTYASNNCSLPNQAPPWPYTRVTSKLIHYGGVLLSNRQRRAERGEYEGFPCPSLLDTNVKLIALEDAMQSPLPC